MRRWTDRLAHAAVLALAGYAVGVIAWDVYRQPYWLGIRREFYPPREHYPSPRRVLSWDEALRLQMHTTQRGPATPMRRW